MDILTGLVLLTGGLGLLGALWVDGVVSQQHAGRISAVSLMVSTLAGLAGAGLAFALSSSLAHASMSLAAAAALCVAVSTDLRFGRLADLTSAIIAISALISSPALNPGLTYQKMMIAAALATGILGLAGLYGRWRQGQAGLGGGDVILAGALALWCAPMTATIGVAAGAALTLLVGLFLRVGASDRLPFGPGLAAGFVLAIVLDILR